MPYSKNPHKYPPEMLMLLESLRTHPEMQVRLPCNHPSEANGRRVMIQSFFRAVELHAEEQARLLTALRAKASSAADRKDRAAKDIAEEYASAQQLAELWEARAFVARQWMVKVEHSPIAVVIQRRTLEGTFGDSLRAFLQGQTPANHASAPALAPMPEASPVPAPDSIEAQFALLRAATEQLEQKQSKTD